MNANCAPSSAPGSRLWFTFLILVCGIAWSLVFSLAKIAGESVHHSLGLAFWTGLGGGLMLLGLSACRRKHLPLDLRSLGFYVIGSVFVTALPTVLIFEIAPRIGPGKLAITVALAPLMTYGGAIVAGIDRGTALRLAGLGLGFGAILLIMLPAAVDDGAVALIWLLIALCIPVTYATGNLLLALRGPRGVDAFALVGAFQLVGAAILLPITLLTGTFAAPGGSWDASQWAVLAMIVLSSLGLSLFLYVLQRTGPVFAAQANYIITIFGVIWGIVLFDESHSPWVWASLVILLSGIALVQERAMAGPRNAP